jgi:translation elongation factor EF-G
MSLTDRKDIEAVQTCIKKYTCPDTLSGKVKYLIDRVINGFKSIFGASDWQKTIQIIQNNAVRFCIENECYDEATTIPLEKKINARILDLTKLFATELLSLALKANQSLNAVVSIKTLEKTKVENVVRGVKMVLTNAMVNAETAFQTLA